MLLLLDSLRITAGEAHWFETGTPSFLVETLFKRRVPSVSLDETVSTADLLSAFDVDHIGTEALLFQTGYLTITAEERLGGMPLYRLGYPNREVRQSLNRVLLRHLVQDAGQQTENSIRLARLLAAHDCAGLKDLFHAFFASIPYDWHTNDDIAKYEGSTPTSRRSATRSWSRSPAATAGWTWRCAPGGTFICSSSKWWSWPPRARRWRSYGSAATRTSIADRASRSI